MAHPPGSDTRASPHRASSGPSARIDARIVFTISYGASGQSTCLADSVSAPLCASARTPICESSERMVRTSFSCGRFPSMSGSRVSSAAHRIGSAAFFAPEMETSPLSATPPSIARLSTLLLRGPLRRRQRLHRQRVDFLTHPVTERAVHELMLLDLGQAREGGANDHGLEMLTVAGNLDMLAGKAGLNRALDVFRGDRDLLKKSVLGASPSRPRCRTQRRPRCSTRRRAQCPRRTQCRNL